MKRMFCTKLKELRGESGLSTMKLGKLIGVSDATICRWENGINDIKGDDLIKLCKFFKVSADYLLGLEE